MRPVDEVVVGTNLGLSMVMAMIMPWYQDDWGEDKRENEKSMEDISITVGNCRHCMNNNCTINTTTRTKKKGTHNRRHTASSPTMGCSPRSRGPRNSAGAASSGFELFLTALPAKTSPYWTRFHTSPLVLCSPCPRGSMGENGHHGRFRVDRLNAREWTNLVDRSWPRGETLMEGIQIFPFVS